MSDIVLNQKEAAQKAQRKGFKVYKGNKTTLLLDLDDSDAYATFEERLPDIQQFFNVDVSDEWTSKSGTGTHVVLTINQELPITHRLLIQMYLGSDPKKEWLSLMRFRMDPKQPVCLLFRPPVKPKKKKRAPNIDNSPVDMFGYYDDDVPF